MNIRIIQDGKTNTYKLGNVSGSAYRKFLVVKDRTMEAIETNNYTVETYDETIDYIVSAFNNQFTANELLDSMFVQDIFLLVPQIDEEIGKKVENKMKKLASTL